MTFGVFSALLLAGTMIVVDEDGVRRDEPPPHGAIGRSTAYRISDAVPGRSMEFRKRILYPGAAIGIHRIDHDEVYYVLSGTGEVTAGARRATMHPGRAAYLFRGEEVGIRQTGREPLTLIIAYPLPSKDQAPRRPAPRRKRAGSAEEHPCRLVP